MSKETKSSFADGLGTIWHPVFTTVVLVKACRHCGITIQALSTLAINVGDLIESLWFACEDQAREGKITREEFMKRITPNCLPEAIEALLGAITEAFPEAAKAIEGGLGSINPFGPGRSRTS